MVDDGFDLCSKRQANKQFKVLRGGANVSLRHSFGERNTYQHFLLKTPMHVKRISILIRRPQR
jgi:hypothetical protein